jgi:hypothetical protein
MDQRVAFATGVPPDIYAFHRSTRNSTPPFQTLAPQFRMHFPGWAGGFHIRLMAPPTRALCPVIPNNACATRITAAAGTSLAGASTGVTSSWQAINLQPFFPRDWTLQPEGLHRPRGVALSRLRALQKILDCSLPKESGQCLSPSVAEQPLSPATHHRLGRPLPYQLANGTWAPP